jgi:hypothetical protein
VTTGSDLRYFVDESLMGLGKALAIARRDVVHPGHPLIPEVPVGALDTDWIPAVARRDLVAICRDRRIRTKSGELAILRASSCPLIVDPHSRRRTGVTLAGGADVWPGCCRSRDDARVRLAAADRFPRGSISVPVSGRHMVLWATREMRRGRTPPALTGIACTGAPSEAWPLETVRGIAVRAGAR